MAPPGGMDGRKKTNGRTDRWTDGQMDGRTNGKSPQSTGLHPLSGLLPKKGMVVVLSVSVLVLGPQEVLSGSQISNNLRLDSRDRLV